MEENRSDLKILTVNLQEEDLLEGLGALGGSILENTEEVGVHTRNWFNSTLSRDYWRALVNAALNLRIPYVT